MTFSKKDYSHFISRCVLSLFCLTIMRSHTLNASEEEIIIPNRSYSLHLPLRNIETTIKSVLKDPKADTFNFSELNLSNDQLNYIVEGLKDRYLVETDSDSDSSGVHADFKPIPVPIFILNLESTKIDADGFLVFLTMLEKSLINREIPSVGNIKIKANFSADENYINEFIRKCPHLATSKMQITY